MNRLKLNCYVGKAFMIHLGFFRLQSAKGQNFNKNVATRFDQLFEAVETHKRPVVCLPNSGESSRSIDLLQLMPC